MYRKHISYIYYSSIIIIVCHMMVFILYEVVAYVRDFDVLVWSEIADVPRN